MALTKYFVILVLVYLYFDISPISPAAIPERQDEFNESDDTTDNYSTTVGTDDDIGKIFETYENMYIKNSNWFNDDKTPTENIIVNSEKPLDIKSEDESNQRDLETTEATADDVVESIHNIIDEKIDSKKNRTDRTIVVVVTTNVFNINGSADSGKRQHTVLSFGTPGMFLNREPTTDPTLTLHNKITSEFFNSKPSPINELEQPSAMVTDEAEKSILRDSVPNDSEEPLDYTEISSTTEGELLDVSTTETPNKEAEEDDLLDVVTTKEPSKQDDYNNFDDVFNIDIRHDSIELQNSFFKPKFDESRNINTLPNDDSNDILRIMKILPSRNDDENNSGIPQKSLEIVQEPQDSSLMEAIENILDTDVRKAFERDIPQTRHVPLDINIEEEALYAPLKDLSEYIVEEVPISGSSDTFKQNIKINDTHDAANNEERAETIGEEKELRSIVKFNQVNGDTNEAVDKSIFEPITEVAKTEATDGEQGLTEAPPKTTITEELTTTATTIEEPKILMKDATPVTDGIECNHQVTEESMTTLTSQDSFGERSEYAQALTSQDSFGERSAYAQALTSQDSIGERSAYAQALTSQDSIGERSAYAQDGKDLDSFDLDGSGEEIPEQVSNRDNIMQLEQIVDDHTVEINDNLSKTEVTYDDASDTESSTTAKPKELIPEPLKSIVVDEEKQIREEFVTPTDSFEKFVKILIPELAAINQVKLNDTTTEGELNPEPRVDTEEISNFIAKIVSTTPTADEEDVVSEVAKVDEETTEQRQIIKKPGVEDIVNTVVETKPPQITNVVSNDLLAKTPSFESRSFSDNGEPVDPLRTLVEGVELTAEITKAFDNFQSLDDTNRTIHQAANQVIETEGNMALVKSDVELNSTEDFVWTASAKYIYISGGVLSIGLIVLLSVVAVRRFRQFKRNIIFTC